MPDPQPLTPDALHHAASRHVHLVYSVCLRKLRDPALADHATQAVFILFARESSRARNATNPTPWFFDAAHRVSLATSALHPSPAPPAPGPLYAAPSDWSTLAPLIDDAVAALPADARAALLLKYVANLPLRDVAEAQGVPDATAGQRISAAVSRLRQFLHARDHPVPPDALVAAIQARFVQPAPANVAHSATLAAVAPPGAPPTPATAIADRAEAARRRRTLASLATAASVLLLLGAGAIALRSIARSNAAAHATPQPTPAPATTDPASPTTVAQRPAPVMPSMPEKAPPPARPEKPLDPDLVARFVRAIRQSDFDAVEALASQEEALVNARDPKTGRSVVTIAADGVMWRRQDATRIAHYLIENGAAANIFTSARAGHRDHVAYMLNLAPGLLDSTDKEGLTPLQRAALVPGASPECEEVADLLIRAGATIDVWTACTLARVGDVEHALAKDPQLVNRPCLGATPLNWATRPRRYPEDPIAIPKLLLDKGADPRGRDTANDGMTPLHHAAAWGGQAAVAQLLLDRGVDVNLPDDYGWTPLDYAIDRGRPEMATFLQSKGGRRTTVDYPNQPSKTARFFAAVQFGDADLVKRLLDDTPELAKARGPTGETPLHHAAAIGSIPIIDLLLADRADVNAQETNKYGGAPLHWAARHAQPDALKHLLAKGADAQSINPRNGQTALHVAAQHTGDATAIDLLLNAGSDPVVKDRFGRTALDYAQQGGHTAAASRLRSPK
jgi:ankyrin repeat protein/DNA-directed RNA polymerase specialized sigma24 family protein